MRTYIYLCDDVYHYIKNYLLRNEWYALLISYSLTKIYLCNVQRGTEAYRSTGIGHT